MGDRPKKLRCAYKYCRHQTHEIKSGTEVERAGKIYHADCLHEMEVIEQIIDYFYRNVNQNVVFWQLRKVLNRLIYQEGFEADYILFALRYHVSHRKPLTYPAGLAYVVQNKVIAAEYQRHMEHIQKKSVSLTGPSQEQSFSHAVVKPKSIESIF